MVLRGQHVLERLWVQPSGEQGAVGKGRSSEQALQPAVWLVRQLGRSCVEGGRGMYRTEL